MTRVNKWTTRELSYHSYRFPLLSTQLAPSVGMELIALISELCWSGNGIWFVRDCDGTLTTASGSLPLVATRTVTPDYPCLRISTWLKRLMISMVWQ